MKNKLILILVILVVFSMAVSIFLKNTRYAVNRGNRHLISCLFQMSATTEFILNYYEEHGEFPNSVIDIFGSNKTGFEDILTGDRFNLLCPLSSIEYIYHKPTASSKKDFVILYCPTHKIKKTGADFTSIRKNLDERKKKIGF